MSLSLPEDLEPYVDDYDDLHSPGAYALELVRPVNLEEQWHRHNDEKPPYWRELTQGDRVFYVGGTGDLISRLEDHRNGDVRTTVLTEVCEIHGLQTVWVGESYEHATEILEPQLHRMLQEEYAGSYVHQR